MSAFASYRDNIEIARDPDETGRVREAAWSRAAKARARLERHAINLDQGART
ncbi:hypothetical protein [uncultured Sphingomonas sp.]|uniref:hypothetical protein n=1 Tax=uncultured Sphingomonas sp. TaxID=158754 RepID=UPI0025CDD36A|nr:hypothetical protein [uncultured Sphingomonas sp.]